jgi:hypothetical protein
MNDSGWQANQTVPTPNPSNKVRGPAIALIIVSSLAIAFGIAGLVGDFFLYSTGALEELEARNAKPISQETTLTIRTVWGIVLLIASSFVLYGSIQMLKLTSYGTARAAAIVAMIPMLGPCCVVGIPFGIWAFVVLKEDSVRNAFR